MKEKSILITHATHPVIQRLYKSIGENFQSLFKGDSQDFPSLLEASGYQKLPDASHSSYPHLILDACLTLEVDYFLPLASAEVKALQGAEVMFAEYGIQVLMPDEPYLNAGSINVIPSKGDAVQLFEKGQSLSGAARLSEAQSGLFFLHEGKEWKAILL